MATHFDLEEQEQLAELKAFWNTYGNAITWLLIAVLSAFAAWNGWQYWQRKTATQAAVLLDELDRAAQAGDAGKVQRVWADMQANVARTAQARQGALLAARALQQAGQGDGARAALSWATEQNDPAVAAVARLRLAGLQLDAKAYDDALKTLAAEAPAGFKGLYADRKGDVWLAKGDTAQATTQYQQAYKELGTDLEYRRIVEAKLNARGVDVQDTANAGGAK
jgi:predicted negative regulator of RcsB-dependent stress response